MKSSLKKLRGFATQTLNHHHRGDISGGKERKRGGHHLHASQVDEVLQASQDMRDMRDGYDGLLSAAAAAANSAFEFSEALKEMGTCLLEKTALNDDEESGKVLLELGKVQFGLQKLVDNYRSHIIKTITIPSERLLNQLFTVEEMKHQCDAKREAYEYMITAQREKNKSRDNKSESFSSEQLRSAQEEYDEEATLFIFRLKSLKQGQSRSLLTQAARHHAAQLSFFQKGTRALEKVEPYVKLIAAKQHIDYHFSGLEDDGSEDGDGLVNYGSDDGELSFDYGHAQRQEHASASMEVDQVDCPFTHSTDGMAKENLEKNQDGLSSFSKGPRRGSHSEPLFPEKKFDPAEKLREMCSSSKKYHSYVLPTPSEGRSSNLASSCAVPVSRVGSTAGWHVHTRHSSPSEPDKSPKNQIFGTPTLLRAQSILKESNINSEATKLPPPLAEEPSRRVNLGIGSDNKKIKRHAFSGPLISKDWSARPMSSRASTDNHRSTFSMPLPASSNQPSTSPKVSPSASPHRPSPKLSDLHELPRPPLITAKPLRPPSLSIHSAPLGHKAPEFSLTSRMPSLSMHMPSPLPTPPTTAMARSLSIPSTSQRAVSVTAVKLLEVRTSEPGQETASSTMATITSSPAQEELLSGGIPRSQNRRVNHDADFAANG